MPPSGPSPTFGEFRSATPAGVPPRDDTTPAVLLIPMAGRCSAEIDGQHLVWGEEQGCVFVPAGSRRTLARSAAAQPLVLAIVPSQLQAMADAMCPAGRSATADLGLNQARVLPMQVAGAPLQQVARHLGALVELYGADAQTLQQSGLQDFIHRQLVLLFRPDWLQPAQETSPATLVRPHKRRAIDRVCDHLLQDLGRRTTLAGMAQQAGMSVRALQYAFQARFGLTPLDWLRVQRLACARQRLERAEYTSITALAQELGFGTSSRFAALYKKHFGEVPSATATRRRRA